MGTKSEKNTYEIWRPGSGHPRRRESWQTVTALQALGKYADRWPDVPLDATAIWWRYLHTSEAIDLGRLRVRVRTHEEAIAA